MKTMPVVVLGALALGAGLVRAEDPIVLKTGETLTTNVEGEAANTSAIWMSDRSVIEKTGAGKWTVESGQFPRRLTANLHVVEGTLALKGTPQPQTTYPEPSGVLAKALFHLDASKPETFVFREGSATEIAEWRDVRETGDGSAANPYLYTRAVTNFQASLNWPATKAFQEKAAVYCGGYGNGVWMNWVKPDGKQATCGGLFHVFVVHANDEGTWGCLLGQRVGQSPYFQHNGNIWMSHNYENWPMHASRTYANGVEIDPFSTGYAANSRIVVEVECLAGTQSAQCFYNDRDMQLKWPDGTQHMDESGKSLNPFFNSTSQTGGGNRVGGGYIHEVILFNTQLTAAERLAVADWLNEKWGKRTPPAKPSVEVALAPGAVCEFAGEGNFAFSGDGEIVKTGEGASRLRSRFVARASSRQRLRVEEGQLDLGYTLPMVVGAGETVDSTKTYMGPRVSVPVAGEDKTKITKTGDGPLMLDAIPDGVKKIEVKGGQLILADPELTAHAVRRPAREISATPAAGGTFGFEEFHDEYASSGTVSIDCWNGQVKYGWHMVVPDQTPGKNDSKVFFFDASYGKDKGTNWSVTIGAQDGDCSMGIKNNASAWTEVNFPEDGVYLYTVWVAGRQGQTGVPMRLLLGKDKDNLEEFGVLMRTDGNRVYHKFSFLTPYVKAGTYQFWIKGPSEDSGYYDLDRCYQYDAMSFVKTDVLPGAYAIPNGDFERWTSGINASSFSLDNTNKVPGFVVKQADNMGTVTSSTELPNHSNSYTTFAVNGCDNWLHFNLPWNRPESQTQFYMSGNGSAITTTFCPPAGTWRFRADTCVWQVTASSGGTYDMEALVAVGDGETRTLGVKTNTSHRLVAYAWPGVFTTDGSQSVTLTVRGRVHAGLSCGHGLLDNLELVPAGAVAQNLLENGGFEPANNVEGYGWHFIKTPKPGMVTGSATVYYDPNTYCGLYFTRDFFEGTYCAKLVNDDWVYHDITLPQAGLYRLTANFMTRCNPQGPISFGSGENPLAVYVEKGGVTNWIGYTDTLKTTNFNEYAFQFRVPEGQEGTYTVGFKGQRPWAGGSAPTVDRTALIDAVMVCPFATEGVIGLPEDLELDLAEGTQLRLDFDGTYKIRRLKINGRRYVGTVSAETHPELLPYLAGRGALEVVRHGSVIILR